MSDESALDGALTWAVEVNAVVRFGVNPEVQAPSVRVTVPAQDSDNRHTAVVAVPGPARVLETMLSALDEVRAEYEASARRLRFVAVAGKCVR